MRDLSCGDRRIYLDLEIRRVACRRCGTVTQEQLRRAGVPRPRVIGLDELSIRKGHSYRLVVSDLERQRPIWFGGWDRSELSLNTFFADLGPRKSARIELAVMDMWKAFENSTRRNAPAVKILFDKFHVLRHLGEAKW